MSRAKDFASALKFAARLHADQTRKGSDAPYISHLLAVAAIALEHGATEKEAIVALLHDAVEDQGGQETLDEIRRRYGNRVARIVAACSDTFEIPKPLWEQRKADYIAAIPSKQSDEARVSLADKVHNARSILFDYRAVGESVFDRFSVDPDKTIGHYRALAGVFAERLPGPLADELVRVVEELEEAVA